MDDLERLLDILVKVLEQIDPKRVRAPFQVSELYQSSQSTPTPVSSTSSLLPVSCCNPRPSSP
jgi:hypothetical protein